MKKLFLSVAFFAVTISFGQQLTNPGSTNGQLNVGSSTFTNDQGGAIRLVPISSTATPYLDFAKFGSTSFARFMYSNNGLSLQYAKLNLDNQGLEFTHSTWSNGYGAKIIGTDDGNGTTSMRFQVRANSASFSDAIRIQTNGKVGIGTVGAFPTNSLYTNYKLFVTGGILTDEVRVKLSASGTWADYVFKTDYKLKSLNEVEQFIKENGHLPNVPIAAHVKVNGIDVADMARIKQEKIEELTLYIIAQNKRIEALEAKMNATK
jgi:hypothetical protein